MPASEKIYYPHNYRFIYAADVWSVKGTDGEELTIQKIVELQNDSGVTLRKAEGKDCKKLGDFAEAESDCLIFSLHIQMILF